MIRAVIFDWAGTVLDHGSRAPMAAACDLRGPGAGFTPARCNT